MPDPRPSTFAETLAAERDMINRRRKRCGIRQSDGRDMTALCLSGGGVRSAAFCLGVMKALAAAGKLKKFDYLSTVSGGGFAGAFVSRWVHESGYAEVESKLSDARAFSDPASPLFHLRKYISYLTPRIGIFSLDSLAGIGLYIRNLFINWLIFVPIFIAAILLIQMVKEIFHISEAPNYPVYDWIPIALATVSIICIGWSFAESLKHRPGGWASMAAPSFPMLFLTLGLPLFVASLLLALLAVLVKDVAELSAQYLFYAASIGAGVNILAFLQALSRAQDVKLESDTPVATGALVASGLSFAVQGAVLAATLATIAHYTTSGADVRTDQRAILLTILSPLVFVGLVYVSEFIYVVLRNRSPKGDLEREWLARSTGAQFRLPTLWALFAAAVLIGPKLLDGKAIATIFGIEITPIDTAGLATGIAGLVTLWLAQARATFAIIKEKYDDWKQVGMRRILSIATPIFILGATALTSGAIDRLTTAIKAANPDLADRPLAVAALLFILFMAIGVAADSWININLFSLHSVYRNRIIRTFLGASNFSRRTGFLDFDENDNIKLVDLQDCNSKTRNNDLPERRIPPQLLVVNMAMNVLASPDLTLQERKAIPFTATPLSVGSGALRQMDPPGSNLPEHARPSGCYRNAHAYSSQDDRSITLGTVAAISGAAFNSNMGYHSSPMLSVLLTIFNLRLGAWLGNPAAAGDKTFTTDGPKQALRPLLEEAFSSTSENSSYVQLSDGGHFDNLGLYEMLVRKCRLIVVLDGGADPLIELGDLGIAQRIALLDQGINISFAADILKDFKDKSTSIAIGKIDYGKGMRGKLIYVKPALQGDEPASVFSYKKANEEFPNESTADQWFNESQFNAYLRLGEHIGGKFRRSDLVFNDLRRPRR